MVTVVLSVLGLLVLAAYPGHAMQEDCSDVENLTIPSKCCYEGRNLLNQTTLRTCAEKQPHNNMEIVLNTLYCYVKETDLMDKNGVIDMEKTRKHFTTNYPLEATDLDQCFIGLNNKPVLNGEVVTQQLIHAVMCLERKVLNSCPDDQAIDNEKCSALLDFKDSCMGRMAKIDYSLGLVNLILNFD